MTALTAPRPTKSLETGLNVWRTFKVKADAIIYPGAMVALGATGYLVRASTATDLRVVGIAAPKREQMTPLKGYIDATGLADGVMESEVQSCIAPMANSGSSITIADVGNDCYVVDDQTVHKTDGSAAGTAQVTEATVVYSAGDATGFSITGIADTISVTAATSAAATATALANAANDEADFFALYTASTDGAKLVITKKTAGTFTLTKQVAGSADLTPITNTTAGVAPTAATRSKAGKIWLVEGTTVWVCLGLPS